MAAGENLTLFFRGIDLPPHPCDYLVMVKQFRSFGNLLFCY